MKKLPRILAATLALAFTLATLTGCALTERLSQMIHGQPSVTDNQTDPEDVRLGDKEKYEEGVIYYNDQGYKYNSRLHIYLMMGVDKEGEVEAVENFRDGGQSDAMFLLIADKEKEELSVFAINRNTMTEIYTCDEEDNYTGDTIAQICVQHGFGDGKRISCSRAVKAVSKLFYNLPIDGYFAVNIGGIPAMNHAVGGVKVEVLEDLNDEAKGVHLTKGETVLLDDDQAYVYLRSRDTTSFGSADRRLERQKQYITAYLDKIRFADNRNSIYKSMYNELGPYMVSNTDVFDVLNELVDYHYSDERMYTIPGQTVMGDKYEEFYVDEEAFYEMILDVFYVPVEEEK